LVYDEHGKKKWIVFECESVGHVQTVIQYWYVELLTSVRVPVLKKRSNPGLIRGFSTMTSLRKIH
jgi:hypothetical protein